MFGHCCCSRLIVSNYEDTSFRVGSRSFRLMRIDSDDQSEDDTFSSPNLKAAVWYCALIGNESGPVAERSSGTISVRPPRT